tara:strand:- start:58 stop:204 length:147 start_codon:yes stop_codon:yes gene_type:complete
MNNYPACAEQKYVMETYHVTFKSEVDQFKEPEKRYCNETPYNDSGGHQ